MILRPMNLSQGSVVTPEGRIRKKEIKTDKVGSLTELQQDFVLFTPAICFLVGYASDAFFIHMFHELGREMDIHYALFQKEMFRGLETLDGDKDWNRALWALPTADWKDFSDFVTSTGVIYRAVNYKGSYVRQELTVIDPINGVDEVKIYAYAVVGSNGVWWLEGKPPTLVCNGKTDVSFFDGMNCD